MSYLFIFSLLLLFVSPIHAEKLYDNHDSDYIHVWEIERIGDVSKIGIDAFKRGSSVGDSMYLMIAVGKIGKLRNYKYMSILGYYGKKKPRYYFVGFSNRADIDPYSVWPKHIKKEQKIKVLPVTMFDRIEALSKKQNPVK